MEDEKNRREMEEMEEKNGREMEEMEEKDGREMETKENIHCLHQSHGR
jgi:hypothetical protein